MVTFKNGTSLLIMHISVKWKMAAERPPCSCSSAQRGSSDISAALNINLFKSNSRPACVRLPHLAHALDLESQPEKTPNRIPPRAAIAARGFGRVSESEFATKTSNRAQSFTPRNRERLDWPQNIKHLERKKKRERTAANSVVQFSAGACQLKLDVYFI